MISGENVTIPDDEPHCDKGTMIHIQNVYLGLSQAPNDISLLQDNNRSCQFPVHDNYMTHIQEACDGRQTCVNLTYLTYPQLDCEASSYCMPGIEMTNYVSIEYRCLRNIGKYYGSIICSHLWLLLN